MKNEKGYMITYKFEIFPNEVQKSFINHHFGCCRLVYNKSLAEAEKFRKKNEEDYRKFIEENPIVKEEREKERIAKANGEEYVKPKDLPVFNSDCPNLSSSMAYSSKNSPLTSASQYREQITSEDGTQFLKEVDSTALNYAQIHLATAYKNFYDKNRPDAKAPRFKKRIDEKKSYTTSGKSIKIDEENGLILLPKFNSKWKGNNNERVGWMKIAISRPIFIKGNPHKFGTATVSCDTDEKFFVSILVYYEKPLKKDVKHTGKKGGVTFGLSNTIAVVTDGNEEYTYTKPSAIKIKRLDRHINELMEKLSKKRGFSKDSEGNIIEPSNNYIKLRKKIRKLKAHRRRIFDYNTHCISRAIVNEFDTLYIRDFDAKNTIQGMKAKNSNLSNDVNARFNKTTTDASIGKLINQLKYKSEMDEKEAHLISKYYPCGRTCSKCGNVLTENPKGSSWVCSKCGTEHKRFINEAINILNEGNKIEDWETYDKQRNNEKKLIAEKQKRMLEYINKLKNEYNEKNADNPIIINKGKLKSASIEVVNKGNYSDDDIIELLKRMVAKEK